MYIIYFLRRFVFRSIPMMSRSCTVAEPGQNRTATACHHCPQALSVAVHRRDEGGGGNIGFASAEVRVRSTTFEQLADRDVSYSRMVVQRCIFTSSQGIDISSSRSKHNNNYGTRSHHFLEDFRNGWFPIRHPRRAGRC
jgi:hypothetical protein